MRVHEREVHMNGCTIRDGASPMGRDESGYLFDIDDVRPRSHRGEQWIREMYHNRDREHGRYEALRREPYGDGRFNECQIADSMRYMTADFGNQEKIKIKLGEDTMATNMTEKEIMAVALLDNFTTVLVAEYEGARNFTFKKPKAMELAEDDRVVVALNDGSLKTGFVVEVHDSVQNPDDIKLAWVVQKIDTEQYDQLLALDTAAVDKIKEMEQRKVKRELLAEFSEDEQKMLGNDLGVDIDA